MGVIAGWRVSWTVGRWRPKKRKGWPKPELHPGVNISKGYIPRVGGRASEDYSVETGNVRSLRNRRQLAWFAVAAAALFALVAWFVWPHAHGLVDLIGAFASLGKYFVLAVTPFVLLAVVVYYYTGAGIEWPVRTASRLVMIASLLGIAMLAAVLVLGLLEGRLDEVRSLGWVVAILVIVGIVGYAGQRDRTID
jgi:hypothetical protein